MYYKKMAKKMQGGKKSAQELKEERDEKALAEKGHREYLVRNHIM